ncbi:hypothetical protein ACFC18_21920, partial [Streptomyces sp. NPDC056121]|uniref:hypothetical protein n=1 Tax=Streptomyces sp. NPDC056121 TaxID=3345718 RepID=UPI0035DBE708
MVTEDAFNVEEPLTQRHITGWSNPQAENVSGFLQVVVARVDSEKSVNFLINGLMVFPRLDR